MTVDLLVPRATSLVPREGADYQRRYAKIGCVIPAYNEEDSIYAVIQAILDQTRPPDSIHVVVNNSNDNTVSEASRLQGRHKKEYAGIHYTTDVYVHDAGRLPDKKVGALNFGWERITDCDFMLGVDGDTILDKRCVEWLEKEMTDDARIGGLSAIYSFETDDSMDFTQKILVAAQKSQFASFEMDNLLRNRNMAVLGGQCSLFRVDALKKIMAIHYQSHPWVRDSEVEDSLLSLQVRSAGYQTKISANARANVGAMLSSKALRAQQIKWTHGTIELLKMSPFHPNMRLRWAENLSMLLNILVRVAFVLLLAGSLALDAFDFHPLWLIPPALAWLLNMRVFLSMKKKTAYDFWYAALFIPTEVYMIMRMEYFTVSWYKSLANVEADNWGAQAAAEKGQGGGQLYTLFLTAIAGAGVYFGWNFLSEDMQLQILHMGWNILAGISVLFSLIMLRRILRKHRGFQV